MNSDVVSVFVDDDTANCSPFTVTIYTAANLLDDLSTDDGPLQCRVVQRVGAVRPVQCGHVERHRSG